MRKVTSQLIILLLCTTISFAQSKVITGRVTDDKGNPVAFATIKVKKSGGVSTAADANGKYTIKANQGDVIVISSATTESREITVSSANVLDVTVALKETQLKEVVVTALGIQRQSKGIGIAVDKIKNEDLTRGKVTNLASGLSSKVSGLDIRLTDNGVNPTVKITLRGNRSLTGNNTALIILDGVPVAQNYVATLNPNDVDNVTILKGANAAALYGKDASNGVLIITTKKGGRGKLTVNFKNSTQFERVSYMPKLQTQYGPYGGEGGGYPDPIKGCKECVSYIDPYTGKSLPVPFENQNFGPAYNSLDYPYGTKIPIAGPLPNGEFVYGDFKPSSDNKTSFFQTGTTIQNDLNLQFGAKWGGIYLSGQRVDTRGVVPEDKYDRTSGRLNGNLNLGKFSANGSFNYSVSNVDIVGADQIQGRNVYWNVINQPAHIRLGDAQWKNVDDPNSPGNLNNYFNAYYQNPWWQIYHSREKSNTKSYTSSLTLSYKLYDWLTVTARSGYSKTITNAPAHIDSFQYSKLAVSDPWGAGNIASSNKFVKFRNEIIDITHDDWNNDAYLTFKKKFKTITATLIAGGNYRQKNSNAGWYYNEADGRIAFSTRVDDPRGGGFATLSFKTRDYSAYGDLSLDYNDWIFLHGSFRNEWTSVLEPSQRVFNYPAVDAAAVLHDKLSFLKNSKYISFFKVRAGYSITGNISIPASTGVGGIAVLTLPTNGAYYINPTVSYGAGFPFDNLMGYVQNARTVQSGLRPEKTHSLEVGTEIGFLRDKIRLEASYFKQITYDQTLPVQTSTASGVQSYLINSGKMQSSGIELDLKLNPFIRSGKFVWNLTLNYSYLDNKVLEILPSLGIDEITIGGPVYASVGLPYPIIKGSDFLRDDKGRIIVDATTGLPTSDPKVKIFGNTSYKDRLGISSNMNWKGFSFNMTWDYRGGAKIANAVGIDMDFTGVSANSAQTRERFVIPNSVYMLNGKYYENTNITVNDATNGWWASTYNKNLAPYIISAAFWKLRELSIGYDFPTKMFGSAKFIKKLTLSITGRNLLMIRPKTNIWTDPEFSDAGVGNAIGTTSINQTPPTRIFGFAVNVTF